MAVLERVPTDQLGTVYTHRGWFLFAPVYIGDIDSESPMVVTRNWVPECVMDLAAAAFGTFAFVGNLLAPDFEPRFPLVITGRIECRS